jgi:hypothetical protein
VRLLVVLVVLVVVAVATVVKIVVGQSKEANAIKF